MFGKREENALGDRLMRFKNSQPVPVLLNFILAHAQGDERAYLEITILGRKILGFLDCGANRTIVNQVGLQILLDLGLKLKKF